MSHTILGRFVAVTVICALGLAASTARASFNLIGVNFTTAGAAIPDPQNWNRYAMLNGVMSNLQDETGAVTGVSLNVIPTVSDGLLYLSTSMLAADATPQYSYSLSGMTGYGFRAGGVFGAEFRGLSPNTPYEYWFVAYRGGGAIDNLVKVSEGDIPDAIQFNQFILFADNDGRFLVNSVNASSMDHWNDLSRTTMSSSTGTIRFNWEGVSQTTVIGALAIREVPEPSMLAALVAAPLMLIRRRRA